MMQKFTLNSAQMIRQLSGSLRDFFLAPGGHPAVGAAVEAGTTCADHTKEKGGKTTGPPHLHARMDFFVEMGQNDKAEGERKATLTDVRYPIDVMDMQNFGDTLSYFKVKKARAEQGQPERWKLCLASNRLASNPWTKRWEDQINAIREGSQGPDQAPAGHSDRRPQEGRRPRAAGGGSGADLRSAPAFRLGEANSSRPQSQATADGGIEPAGLRQLA
ncbi:unnamed protein product [Prorocentrum cordatum]|uniref:Uncharacterized protein n=1 Tax=Prorocentrum cordatum TaxID=2364126 RepID=A0ABN9PK77_9DINO|nr:unnamed protein product [Polarella glacialis]